MAENSPWLMRWSPRESIGPAELHPPVLCVFQLCSKILEKTANPQWNQSITLPAMVSLAPSGPFWDLLGSWPPQYPALILDFPSF